MRLRRKFATGMGQTWGNWFTPQSIMVQVPKIKSVSKCIRDGITVDGGKNAKMQGQQGAILNAGVRAIASTILHTNLLSSLSSSEAVAISPYNGGIPVRDAGKVN